MRVDSPNGATLCSIDVLFVSLHPLPPAAASFILTRYVHAYAQHHIQLHYLHSSAPVTIWNTVHWLYYPPQSSMTRIGHSQYAYHKRAESSDGMSRYVVKTLEGVLLKMRKQISTFCSRCVDFFGDQYEWIYLGCESEIRCLASA